MVEKIIDIEITKNTLIELIEKTNTKIQLTGKSMTNYMTSCEKDCVSCDCDCYTIPCDCDCYTWNKN